MIVLQVWDKMHRIIPLTFTSDNLQKYAYRYESKIQITLCFLFELFLEWKYRMDYGMPTENFNMEWKILRMEYSNLGIKNCQYGIWKNRLLFHTMP